MPYPKRLIEVDLPIKKISIQARREKSIRHGHISTLHIWWARRPLASCRAVLCAALWPDPEDELCPKDFIERARIEMKKWANSDYLFLLSIESQKRFQKLNHDKTLIKNNNFLRILLFEFIAEFSNWDNSSNRKFLETSQSLTKSAHESLGGIPNTLPLIVDPFAGGGSIPLEALRIGADTFASDLNPVAYLLNKIVVEYIPRYGEQLITEVRKWSDWVKLEAKKDLAEYYPANDKKEVPIAYLWARTVQCEGPGCGAIIPTIGSPWLSKRKGSYIAYTPKIINKSIEFDIVNNPKTNLSGFLKRSSLTCPVCGFTTNREHVADQMNSKNGGTVDAKLLFILRRTHNGKRVFSKPTQQDLAAIDKAKVNCHKILKNTTNRVTIPDEDLPYLRSIFNVNVYGVHKWRDMFSPRQLISLQLIAEKIASIPNNKELNGDLRKAVLSVLTILFGRVMVRNTAFCIWDSTTQCIMQLFNQGQSLPMRWEYAEMVPFSEEGSGWDNSVEYILNVLKENQDCYSAGNVICADAAKFILPDDSASAMFTDPPYYDSVPYANLSDFFYIWQRRILMQVDNELYKFIETNKLDEIVQLAERNEKYASKTKEFYESRLTTALENMRKVVIPSGVGIVVFAHKTTEGWEAAVKAVIDSGWIVTGSWPIDTESTNRLRAKNSAALASSVHLVCRPRENIDDSTLIDQIGDWRDVQNELPQRIHEWMPRLAEEGIAGADAIFACIGPALEIFSRYSHVEKPDGRIVSLKEFLEKVWAAVSQEAINMVFSGGDAQSLEEDARLTAMWLWTLTAGINDNGNADEEGEIEEESTGSGKLVGGYTLEYDTARKIAQGLGANLEELKTLVEVKGDKARLLPVIERANKLFGATGKHSQAIKKKKKVQLTLSFDNIEAEDDLKFELPELKMEQTGITVLDRLHQSMLLFSTGRTDALKRFLVEDGAGKDDRFWKLAQALTSLYPKDTDERRWVEAVQTYKKNLGF